MTERAWVTGLFRDGDPADSVARPQPFVRAVRDLGVDAQGRRQMQEFLATYAGVPPPPLIECDFTHDGQGHQWHCEGPADTQVDRIVEEEFATLLLPATQTWTPTLSQGASTDIAKTINWANYWRLGPLVFFDVQVTATAAGTTNNAIKLSLPVTPSRTTGWSGIAFYSDSGVAIYPAQSSLDTGSTIVQYRNDVVIAATIGVAPNIAVASGDSMNVFGYYLAA